ncbi:flagellar hook protein FlgE [Xanthobacter sediminis]
MSLYGMMRTSVSGMGAQSNLLSTVADNIANSGTTGYKNANAEFSSVMLQSETGSGGDYQSGSVKTGISYGISQQGALDYVGKSNTDLAIQGNGFFLVTDPSGQTALTRAGDFKKDASTGNLVNGAGYTLMGYALKADGTPDTTSLVPVNVDTTTVTAEPSSVATFAANLPLDAAIGDTYTTSMTAYDALGSKRTVNLSFEKTAAGEWEMTVDGDVTGSTTTLTFDTSGNLTTTPATLTVPVENSQDPTVTTNVVLDFSGMSQKDMDYTVTDTKINGTAASVLSDVSIDSDGTVYAMNANGDKLAKFKIPLGNVSSPDNLTPITGNAFVTNTKSGNLMIGTAESGGLGTVVGGATENSTVDTANELTTMIVAQRDYTANSKVFQTGSELLDVLMNLKR